MKKALKHISLLVILIFFISNANAISDDSEDWYYVDCPQCTSDMSLMFDENIGTRATLISNKAQSNYAYSVDVRYNGDFSNKENAYWNFKFNSYYYFNPSSCGDIKLQCKSSSGNYLDIGTIPNSILEDWQRSFSIDQTCLKSDNLELRISHNCISCTSASSSVDIYEEWITYEEGICNNNGICDSGEDFSNCPADCYEDWKISFVDPPDSANSGDNVPIQVKVENIGTIDGTTRIQAAIYPDKWSGAAFATDFDPIIIDISDCCPGEIFVDTKYVTIAKDDYAIVTFDEITAQSPDTESPCAGDAWDTSFTLFAGTFENCGESYTHEIARDFSINYCEETYGCDSCLDKPDGTTSANSCDCNAECESEICSGEGEEYTVHCTDGEDAAATYRYYYEIKEDSCGGEGTLKNNGQVTDISCDNSETGCTDCICDEDHDDSTYSYINPPCRVKIGGSCSETEQCWNDDEGNWCNSISECTDGSDGRDCGNDDDCNSGFCLNGICSSAQPTERCPDTNTWYCENDAVYKCEADGEYIVGKVKESCILDKYCDPANVNSIHTCSSGELLAIESANPETIVYKQPGDNIVLNIYSSANKQVSLEYDANIMTTDCINPITLSIGNNLCKFSIYDNATIGNYTFNIGINERQFAIIDNPKLIILTNSDKLKDEFSNDPKGVNDLLAKGHEFASGERGVLYDLISYDLPEHPFPTFTEYNEEITQPHMLDNSYSLAIADFVNDKCIGCKDVMIIGDDFIVPSYRKNDNFYFSINDIHYTDSAYIQSSAPSISDFDYNKFFSVGKIKIIYPDYLDYQIVDSLRNSIFQTYRYQTITPDYDCFNQHGTYIPCDGCDNYAGCKIGNEGIRSIDDVEVYPSSYFTLGCNNFDYFKDSTLVIIGDKTTNPLLNCYPGLREDEYSIMTLERNIWDPVKNSIIINTDSSSTPNAVYILDELVKNGEWRAYFDGRTEVILKNIGLSLIPLEPCTNVISYGPGVFDVDFDELIFCTIDAVGVALFAGKAIGSVESIEIMDEVDDLSELAQQMGKLDEVSEALAKSGSFMPKLLVETERISGTAAKYSLRNFFVDHADLIAKMSPDDFKNVYTGADETVRFLKANGLDLGNYIASFESSDLVLESFKKTGKWTSEIIKKGYVRAEITDEYLFRVTRTNPQELLDKDGFIRNGDSFDLGNHIWPKNDFIKSTNPGISTTSDFEQGILDFAKGANKEEENINYIYKINRKNLNRKNSIIIDAKKSVDNNKDIFDIPKEILDKYSDAKEWPSRQKEFIVLEKIDSEDIIEYMEVRGYRQYNSPTDYRFVETSRSQWKPMPRGD